ncbi:MAG: RNA polymerase sigma factor [Pseudomonadota bacterium]
MTAAQLPTLHMASHLSLMSQLGSRLGRAFPGGRTAVPAGEDWAMWHRASHGDGPSATSLVRLLTPRAHGIAMQLLRRNEDAQDVVQESFLRLWNSRPSDACGAQLATFFNTIVINRCKTHLVRRREFAADHDTLVALADAQQVADPAGAHEGAFTAFQLQQALGTLGARQRMALAMWAYADAEPAEIARALEMDANAAHQLLHRAKLALRSRLEGAGS